MYFYQEEEQYHEIPIHMFLFNDGKRMTPIQNQAMRYMNQKCQIQHNQTKSALQQRVSKLGYSAQDLNRLQFYVQNLAPIIVHVHISKHMEFFIKDTNYRNQFQTKKSSGTLSRQTRVIWEDRIFDKKYSAANDFQRVKYGVINFTQDPKGVESCLSYGQSYFILKPHVRKRCTFSDKDSSYTDSSIGTLKYSFKILNKLTDKELKAAFNASQGQEVSSKCLVTYKQIQIHGPIQFSKDIQVLKVNIDEITKSNNLQMIQTFSKKYNVKYQYFSRNIEEY